MSTINLIIYKGYNLVSNKFSLVILFLLFLTTTVFSQKQVATYFEEISNKYKTVKDYKASIKITSSNNSTQKGTMWVKGPRALINFKSGEVISINEGQLIVYVKNKAIALEQEMSGINAGSAEGLRLLGSNYKYSYNNKAGYKLVSLDKKSHEKVIKLLFSARRGGLEYRRMIISFDSNHLIRRIEGFTISGASITFDFMNIRINQNISDMTFEYKVPGSAHSVKNFIYTPE